MTGLNARLRLFLFQLLQVSGMVEAIQILQHEEAFQGLCQLALVAQASKQAYRRLPHDHHSLQIFSQGEFYEQALLPYTQSTNCLHTQGIVKVTPIRTFSQVAAALRQLHHLEPQVLLKVTEDLNEVERHKGTLFL